MTSFTCPTCAGTYPPTAEFWQRRANSTTGFRAQCKPCIAARKLRWKWVDPEKVNAYSRKWTAANPSASAEWKLRNPATLRRYRGHPEPTRPRPETCELCGRTNGRRVLALDHCHATGKFRGWLCTPCNTAIGKLGDNQAGLIRALAYLARSCEDTHHTEET